ILLVEDHDELWDVLAHYLPEYKLICARDFEEGLRLARRRYFDLYILDNWLPDGFGVELCRSIRRFDPNTPILFYSAAAYARDIEDGLRAGAQGYLVKPVDSKKLKQAVSEQLSLIRERDFQARQAEIAAIQAELAIRQMENAERVEKAKEKRLRAEE